MSPYTAETAHPKSAPSRLAKPVPSSLTVSCPSVLSAAKAAVEASPGGEGVPEPAAVIDANESWRSSTSCTLMVTIWVMTWGWRSWTSLTDTLSVMAKSKSLRNSKSKREGSTTMRSPLVTCRSPTIPKSGVWLSISKLKLVDLSGSVGFNVPTIDPSAWFSNGVNVVGRSTGAWFSSATATSNSHVSTHVSLPTVSFPEIWITTDTDCSTLKSKPPTRAVRSRPSIALIAKSAAGDRRAKRMSEKRMLGARRSSDHGVWPNSNPSTAVSTGIFSRTMNPSAAVPVAAPPLGWLRTGQLKRTPNRAKSLTEEEACWPLHFVSQLSWVV